MIKRVYPLILAVVLAGCADPEAARRLEADTEAVKARISQARDERKVYGKGSVAHDLISLRIAIHEQTLAMLEQRRLAGKWRTALSYSVDGKSWAPPGDAAKRLAALEARLKNTREGRESDLQLLKGSADSIRPLYVMSVATKTILISQLEYQQAATAHGFPPYYVPFSPAVRGTTPPQMIEVPAGKTAVVH